MSVLHLFRGIVLSHPGSQELRLLLITGLRPALTKATQGTRIAIPEGDYLPVLLEAKSMAAVPKLSILGYRRLVLHDIDDDVAANLTTTALNSLQQPVRARAEQEASIFLLWWVSSMPLIREAGSSSPDNVEKAIDKAKTALLDTNSFKMAIEALLLGPAKSTRTKQRFDTEQAGLAFTRFRVSQT